MLKKHLFKVLGISMLAAIGVMVVSASTAQAKWEIKVSGKSVASANFFGSIGAAEALVPGLLTIGCTGGTASVTAKVVESGAKLIGSGSAQATGCIVKDAMGKVNKNCTINSPGSAAGTIKGSGSGEVEMEGAKSFGVAESSNFAETEINGALCPLNEFDSEFSGSATATLLNVETEAKAHTVELADQALFFGENEASLHSGANPISGTGVLASGDPWTIQLVE